MSRLVLTDGGVGPAPPGAEYIYDDDELRTFDLTIDPADLAFLDADPAAEIYVAGTFSFEGVDYPNMGVRYKGGGGSFNGCVENRSSGSTRASGAKTCAKLSLKIPYDEQPATVGNGMMVALAVREQGKVDEVYARAMELGSPDEGPPGPRGETFYGGYFRDPDGNKLCVYTFTKPE